MAEADTHISKTSGLSIFGLNLLHSSYFLLLWLHDSLSYHYNQFFLLGIHFTGQFQWTLFLFIKGTLIPLYLCLNVLNVLCRSISIDMCPKNLKNLMVYLLRKMGQILNGVTCPGKLRGRRKSKNRDKFKHRIGRGIACGADLFKLVTV